MRRITHRNSDFYTDAGNARNEAGNDPRVRALIARATMPWSDPNGYREIYRLARRHTRETGIKHTVDHVIPLRGNTVSGLHVRNNLRVIPARENETKSNRWEWCDETPQPAQPLPPMQLPLPGIDAIDKRDIDIPSWKNYHRKYHARKKNLARDQAKERTEVRNLNEKKPGQLPGFTNSNC